MTNLVVAPDTVLKTIQDLSLLVIMYPGKWHADEFHPSCYSKKIIDWFEGTGTIIGRKRNRVFILSSIHCNPGRTFTFLAKGSVTQHKQIPLTLVANYFVVENNGIDVSVFSCDVCHLEDQILATIDSIEWRSPDSFRTSSPIWLVHYPTSSEPDGAVSTHRLFNECFPTVSEGVILSSDLSNCTIDSTIVATGGSSGGLLVNEHGHVLGVHDSQHDETPDQQPVSTHRLISELRVAFQNNKQLQSLLYSHN